LVLAAEEQHSSINPGQQSFQGRKTSIACRWIVVTILVDYVLHTWHLILLGQEKNMRIGYLTPWFTMVTTLVLFLAGCSTFDSYGKLKSNYAAGDEMTIGVLEELWEEYTVYYAGCCGYPIEHPSAVMFDPKGDDKQLVGTKWRKIETKYRLSKAIRAIKGSPRIANFYPILYQIIDPEGEVYGYMYTSWKYVYMEPLDDNSMRVLNIPYPPYLDRSLEAGPPMR
jgi:hypothetical protein